MSLTLPRQTTSLGNAYGMCVIIVTLITTCMLALVGIIIWRIPSIFVIFVFLFFFAMEGAFMSATLRKVPHGAWFTLVLAVVLSSIFILWRWGKRQQWTAEAEDTVTSSDLLGVSSTSSSHDKTKGDLRIRCTPNTLAGTAISTIPGLGIFFDKTGGFGDDIPKVFSQFITKFRSRPEVTVFFHMRPLSVPSIPLEERFVITRASSHIPSSYRLTLRHGYMDNILTPDLGLTIITRLTDFIRTGSQRPDQEARVQRELESLKRAEASNTVHILGKQVMRVRDGQGNLVKRFSRVMLLELFLWIRENSRTKVADFDMDYNNLVEVGFVKEI
jgi:KUP system potassium uptake protein